MANTTTINSELFTRLLAEAQFAAYENSVARQIVTPFDVAANQGKVVQVPVWAGITADTPTEGSAATAKDTNTTEATITLAEAVAYFQITDMLRDSAGSDVISSIANQAGRAIAEAMDDSVYDLFTSFTTEMGPGAGAELTVEHLMKSAATLRTNKLTGPFVAVLHPKQAYNVKKQLSNAGGSTIPSLSNVGNEVLSRFYIGSVSGIEVYESGLIAVDGSDDAIGAVFAKSAIGHAMRGTLKIEEQRDAKTRATDLVVSAVHGAAILQDTHGVKLTSDAAL